jgi:hypothetical protein
MGYKLVVNFNYIQTLLLMANLAPTTSKCHLQATYIHTTYEKFMHSSNKSLDMNYGIK